MTHDSDKRFAPRVTVATVLPGIGPNQHRFLFVEETVGHVLVINQPAGHLDEGETLAQAAVRETLEETGWDVQLRHLVGVYQYAINQRAYLRFAFAASALHHHTERALDSGIVRTLWLSRDELIARQQQQRSPMVLQCLDAYLAGERHSLSMLHALGTR
jgi:8-oxo-dGTP pyrophosphatase MutT (NUDIX family)